MSNKLKEALQQIAEDQTALEASLEVSSEEELKESEEIETEEVDETEELEESEEESDETEEVEEAGFQPIDESVFKAQLTTDLGSLLEGTEFSEEFKAKATTIFEAAVEARVKNEIARLNHFANNYFTEQVRTTVESLEEQTEKFVETVAQQWLSENAIAIESATKVQLAESIFAGLKNVLVENNFEVPEGSEDLLETAEAEIEELSAKLSEAEERAFSLQKTLAESKKSEMIRESLEGMTDLQKSKIMPLIENVAFLSETDFAGKLTSIKDTFLTEKTVVSKASSESTLLSEGINNSKEEPTQDLLKSADPEVANIARAISFQATRNK